MGLAYVWLVASTVSASSASREGKGRLRFALVVGLDLAILVGAGLSGSALSVDASVREERRPLKLRECIHRRLYLRQCQPWRQWSNQQTVKRMAWLSQVRLFRCLSYQSLWSHCSWSYCLLPTKS